MLIRFCGPIRKAWAIRTRAKIEIEDVLQNYTPAIVRRARVSGGIVVLLLLSYRAAAVQ